MKKQKFPKVIASAFFEKEGKYLLTKEILEIETKNLNLVSSAKWLFEKINP